MAYAYISYCEETRRAAEALRLRLEADKVSVWMAAGDLVVWMHLQIREQIAQESACAVLLIPGQREDSREEELPDWARKERKLLQESGATVIPVYAGELEISRVLELQIDFIRLNELAPVPALEKQGARNLQLLARIRKCVRDAEAAEKVRLGRWPTVKDGPAEAIEWHILTSNGNKLLLVSRYGLEAKVFSKYRNSTWNDCSLREWLNEDFFLAAFSEEERGAILETTVEPDPNPEYETEAGEACSDKLFVFSLSEFKRYFASGGDDLRCCEPTPRAKWQGAFAWGDRLCLWWLRTPGMSDNLTTYVNAGGTVDLQGCYAQRGEVCVRPAMWVDKALLPLEEE